MITFGKKFIVRDNYLFRQTIIIVRYKKCSALLNNLLSQFLQGLCNELQNLKQEKLHYKICI